MAKNKFKFDLKTLTDLKTQLPKEASEALGKFTHQLSGYEEKVRGLVKDFDVKSQKARETSRERLDQFAKQVKKTRNNVEKKVVGLVTEERERLQLKVNDLVEYLRRVAKVESSSPKRKASAKSTSSRATSAKKKTPAKRKAPAKRIVKANSVGEGLPSA